MIKRILLAISLILSSGTLAAEQYSQAHCDRIEAERENIRERMRSSYTAALGERLRKRSTALFEQLGRHCKSPTKTSSRSGSRTYMRSSANDLLNKKVYDFTVYSKTYDSDSKRLQWNEFYQHPERCRTKDMQKTDFVWCSENRAEQRARFEAQWQPSNKVSNRMNNSGVVKSQIKSAETPSITHSMTLTPVSKAQTRLTSTVNEEEVSSQKVWQLVVVGCLALIGVFGFYRWFKD
ncbi:hypothetical protein [Pseudoalteromonas sp. ZZD1]|uniref:hypothetical protein n=1 Tax=Pseudoalteromonas sp. ZZD1 TaxID=3139395 RepID=UPI003BAA5F12